MNRKMTDLIVVGFALFSMFLGAGNLIFPPYLGLHAGETWLPALIGFLLTGVGLPLMTVYATLRSGAGLKTSSLQPCSSILIARITSGRKRLYWIFSPIFYICFA